jgi:hypothetical protein
MWLPELAIVVGSSLLGTFPSSKDSPSQGHFPVVKEVKTGGKNARKQKRDC